WPLAPPQVAVHVEEDQAAKRRVHHGARQQAGQGERLDPHVEGGGQPLEDERVHERGREQDQHAGPRLREVEARPREADAEAHQHLGQAGQAHHAPAELHVLHPAAGGSGEHGVGLPPHQAAVDEHQHEEVHHPGLAGHDVREGGLEEEGHQQGQGRPEDLHRTDSVSCGVGGVAAATMTSSIFSKFADGCTATSLKSPDPFPTERTRPTTGPLGYIWSSPDVTTTSPTATSARTGTYFMSSSEVPESEKATWPATTPVVRVRSMRTPIPLSRSSRSWTLAARGPTSTTRPITPPTPSTGAFSVTPSLRPLSMVMLRNQGTPSRAMTCAVSVGKGRIGRSSRISRRRAASPICSWLASSRLSSARTCSWSRRFSSRVPRRPT